MTAPEDETPPAATNPEPEAPDEDVDDEADLDAPPPAAPPARRAPIIVALIAGLVVGVIAGATPFLLRHTARPSATPSAAASTVPSTAPSVGSCAWYDSTFSTTKVGKPATAGVPHSGPATLTVVTDAGTVVVSMDAGRTPCAVAALAHLAGHGFYDHDTCTRGPDGLECGNRDPDFVWTHEDTSRYPRVLVTRSFQARANCADLPKDVCKQVTDSIMTMVSENVVAPPGTVFLTAAHAHPAIPEGSGVFYLPGGVSATADGGAFVICAKETQLPADSTPLGTVTSGMEIVRAWAGGHSGQLMSVTVTYG